MSEIMAVSNKPHFIINPRIIGTVADCLTSGSNIDLDYLAQ